MFCCSAYALLSAEAPDACDHSTADELIEFISKHNPLSSQSIYGCWTWLQRHRGCRMRTIQGAAAPAVLQAAQG